MTLRQHVSAAKAPLLAFEGQAPGRCCPASQLAWAGAPVRVGHRSQLHTVHEDVRDGVHAGQQQVDSCVVKQGCGDVEGALESPCLRCRPSQLNLVIPGRRPQS